LSTKDFNSKKEQVKGILVRTVFKDLYPEHFREPGPQGTHFVLCPFHNDTNPSFELKTEKNIGKCWGSCNESFDTISLWTRARRCDFKAAVNGLYATYIGSDGGKVTDYPKTVVQGDSADQIHDYRDEAGNLLFQVLRWGTGNTKRINQRRPDPNHEGKWIWKLKNTRRTLYRLLEVISSDEVWIVEGEKCADALAEMGFCATTNPHGSGKWPGLVTDWEIHTPLEGKTVFILPDNDKPGKEHARDVATTLHGFAATVKIIELPGLPQKGDVCDFVESHGPDEAKRELVEIAERTPLYEPPPLEAETDGASEEESETKKTSKTQKIIRLLEEGGAVFFTDQFKRPWARLRIDDHCENILVRGDLFRNYLSVSLYGAAGEACGSETLVQVQNYCSAKAAYDGEALNLAYRTAGQDGKILIDLGTRDWSSAEVSPDGWRIVQPEKPPFRRFSHTEALPTPVKGGTIQEILSVINVRDPLAQALLCVWIPSVFIPDIPRAGILFTGTHGSGKTYASAKLKTLVDPSRVTSLRLPKDVDQLVQQLDHHMVPMYDNLGGIPQWASDALCAATTGMGHSKRALYSNDEDFVYWVMSPYILNGITVIPRPDLADRILTIELERLTDNKTTAELEVVFEDMRPRVFGAILDTLSTAMRNYATVDVPQKTRLADWHQWASPIAEAIGVPKETLSEALEQNASRHHDDIVQDDPVAAALLEFVEEERTPWKGTASVLYECLVKTAARMSLDKGKSWPRAANTLSKRLRVLKVSLDACGITVVFSREAGKERTKYISITKVAKDGPKVLGNQPSEPSNIDSLGANLKDTKVIQSDRWSDGRGQKGRATGRDTVRHKSLKRQDKDGSDGSDSSDPNSSGIVSCRLTGEKCQDFTTVDGGSVCFYDPEGKSGSVIDLSVPDVTCPKTCHSQSNSYEKESTD
jgi:5S rRNA maturation endonuclease (ribonuclease M5)